MKVMDVDDMFAVIEFFDAIEPGLSENVLGDRILAWGGAGCPEAVCMVTEAVINQVGFDTAHHAGLRIGTLENGQFGLDLQGAMIMAPHTLRMKVQVRHKSAQIFLYGKPILGDGIKRHDKRLQEGDHCLVLDGHNDCLGIGVVVGKFKGNWAAIESVHDLGAYLREQ